MDVKSDTTQFSFNRSVSRLVWLRLLRVVQNISRHAEAELDAIDISAPQFNLLVQIQTAEGISQQELAERLQVTKGNISQLISKLEKRGLLKRQKEGRMSNLKLTANGQTLVNRLLPEHDAFIARQFAALTADEQQQLLSLLRKLEQSLK